MKNLTSTTLNLLDGISPANKSREILFKELTMNVEVYTCGDSRFDSVSEKIESMKSKSSVLENLEYQKVFDELLQQQLGYLDYRILSAGIISYRRAREAALKPYPHVTATIMSLVKSNIKLAIVSDAPAREAWLRLCHINFHHTFDVVVTYDDTK